MLAIWTHLTFIAVILGEKDLMSRAYNPQFKFLFYSERILLSTVAMSFVPKEDIEIFKN
jgi:hypothetical protein